ncbi:hypothetical protein LOTGIDRAFT_155742 [Lottia gigantea]|uniref:BHLH domain-containing protein n=1 Tax=Lottia gigantea TaxID=225164 RepID=V3ZK13_LOTGI|nr:hypothetical protein LOTGIDRAFT_155742 [Lottia gigantea]ESO82725.1 hypothetical protein LOTGIDRAFT_155742 [Lottia gigantea]
MDTTRSLAIYFQMATGNGHIGKEKCTSKAMERRNARERNRISHMKTQFKKLQTKLPEDWQTNKMSKLDVLKKTIRYIRQLEDVLSGKQQFDVDFWAMCNPMIQNKNDFSGSSQTIRTVKYQSAQLNKANCNRPKREDKSSDSGQDETEDIMHSSDNVKNCVYSENSQYMSCGSITTSQWTDKNTKQNDIQHDLDNIWIS